MTVNELKRVHCKSIATTHVTLTIEEARSLPNMLGRIVPVELQLNGWYARNDPITNNVTYYERKDTSV